MDREPKPAIDDGLDADFVRRGVGLIDPLRLYHRHEVRGLEKIPPGAVIIALNHSLATYDGVMLAAAIIRWTGRLPRGLGDRAIFRTPLLRDFARKVGIVEADPDNGRELLARGELVMLAPGGMRESLKPSPAQRGEVLWDRRKGFARLALETGTPVMLAACPEADDIYRVYENPLTKIVYRRFRLPFPLIRGLGPTLIPKPVKLVHRLAGPFPPPSWSPSAPGEPVPDDLVDAYHAQLVNTMRTLLRSEAE